MVGSITARIDLIAVQASSVGMQAVMELVLEVNARFWRKSTQFKRVIVKILCVGVNERR